MKNIWFDMDGTIADLYGVENWLAYLIAEDTKPYEVARPLVNLSKLARYLNQLQRNGYKIGIISWTSKNGSENYNLRVAAAKMKWLAIHLKSVKWNYTRIVEYGTNKWNVCGNGILFDDEERNRESWDDEAYEPNMIFEILKKLTED